VGLSKHGKYLCLELNVANSCGPESDVANQISCAKFNVPNGCGV
jgi:hypothetical protein